MNLTQWIIAVFQQPGLAEKTFGKELTLVRMFDAGYSPLQAVQRLEPRHEVASHDAIIHRERAIVAMRVGTNVAARIRKMHPDGLREFDVIRGNYRKPSGRPINQDILPRRSVIEKRGREFWDSAPRSAFVRQGRRKFMTARYLRTATH